MTRSGEDRFEDDLREVRRNALLVASPLRQRVHQEAAGRAVPRDEGVAAEEQEEGAEVVFGAGLEDAGEVGLVVGGGVRACAVVVEPPDGSVGEEAPAGPSQAVGRREVAEDLTVGRAGLDLVVGVAGVEGAAEALALLDHEGVAKAIVGVASAEGAGLRGVVGEEEEVGDVLVAGGALLRETVGPAERAEDGPDEFLLGGRFVGVVGSGEAIVEGADGVAEGGGGIGGGGHCGVALMPSVRK